MRDSLAGATGVHVDMQGQAEYNRAATAACGVRADFEGFNWTAFLRDYAPRITVHYILTLDDGILEPITIPIYSFQARLKSGDPTFLSVVMFGNDQYADILEREDAGAITLTMQYLLDGEVYRSEDICTVDLEAIRVDQGSGSVSVTMYGHRTVTHKPKIATLSGSSYKSIYLGKIRYRCSQDLYLRPGDTCKVNGDEFIVGLLTCYTNPDWSLMEVEEA